jgi:hypothetical protein
MNPPVQPLDLNRLKVFPLSERHSLTRVEDILIDPESPAPPPANERIARSLQQCAADLRAARERGATVMLIYGAHLLRNGTALILDRLMAGGWLTHLATNGAGTIHDWEYAWFGSSTESVEMNVANGTFGAWHETATNIHLALMAGALRGLGYGRALGKFINDDGTALPLKEALRLAISSNPSHPLTGARVELLRTMQEHGWPEGPALIRVEHRWKHASIVAAAWRHSVPGIGYDIISNHPVFNGAVIGRAAEADFKLFAGSVERLDGGVVLNIGSAIMGPQVFEKTLSCVNNLRLQAGRGTVGGHSIHVVDIQDGGGWDWTQGEPPKTNPAYYLRFCKSCAHMRQRRLHPQSLATAAKRQ